MAQAEDAYVNILPHYSKIDRTAMPSVQLSLDGIRRLVVGPIARFRAGDEMYAPTTTDAVRWGLLSLSQAQARHLYAELGKHITAWDTEPRDLEQEVDKILSSAAGHRFTSRTRASQGYEVETWYESDSDTVVFVYHHDGRERIGEDSPHLRYLYEYAETLKGAGYTGVEVQAASEQHGARVHAIPPAAESF